MIKKEVKKRKKGLLILGFGDRCTCRSIEGYEVSGRIGRDVVTNRCTNPHTRAVIERKKSGQERERERRTKHARPYKSGWASEKKASKRNGVFLSFHR